jgi:hypothetical protein
MKVTMASTRKDTSRIANAGLDTGANMLGVGAPPVAAAITRPAIRSPCPLLHATRGTGDHQPEAHVSSPWVCSGCRLGSDRAGALVAEHFRKNALAAFLASLAELALASSVTRHG